MFKVFRTTKRRFKTERITLSWSSFSRIWMKPKCNLPPKWSARRRSLSWRPRYAEQTSHTRSFCCWKLDAGIEFRYSSYREARKPSQMSGNLYIDTTLQGSPSKELLWIIKTHPHTKEVPHKCFVGTANPTVCPCKGLVTKYFRGQSRPPPQSALCTRQKFLKIFSFTTLPPLCWHMAGNAKGSASTQEQR